MLKESHRTLLLALSLLFVITFACGLAYLIAQQIIRQGANTEPAILATETAIKLNAGNPNDSVPADKVDLSRSLEPFVMVLDSNWHTIASSATMGKNMPAFPALTASTFQNGDARITWEPLKGLRFATVTVKYSGGYIVAGQSLKEAERLEDNIFSLVLFAWIGGVALAEICLWLISRIMKKGNAREQ
jgi:hypothetical protein